MGVSKNMWNGFSYPTEEEMKDNYEVRWLYKDCKDSKIIEAVKFLDTIYLLPLIDNFFTMSRSLDSYDFWKFIRDSDPLSALSVKMEQIDSDSFMEYVKFRYGELIEFSEEIHYTVRPYSHSRIQELVQEYYAEVEKCK